MLANCVDGLLKSALCGSNIVRSEPVKAQRGDVINVATNVLRMVKHVEGLDLEFNAEALGNVEALQGSQVNVVDRSELQSIAAYICKRPIPSLDILSVRVNREVAHDAGRRMGSWRLYSVTGQDVAPVLVGTKESRPCPFLVRRWDSRIVAIAGAISVQVGVKGTLCGDPLARLVGVDGSNFPIAKSVFQQVVTILEERFVVDHRQRHAMPVIKNGVGAVSAEVQTILRTSGSQNCAEHLGGCVVNIMAVGIGQHTLQAMAKALG